MYHLYPNENQTSYHYEECCGKPSVITYANGEELHFEYDIANRKIAQEDTCGRTEYHYNARNRKTIVRDGEGNETHWMYDKVGRLSSLYPPKAWNIQQGETTYSYDFLDHLIDTTYPDGAHKRQIKDGEGTIIKEIHPNTYNVKTDDGEGITYEYDSNGNNIRIHYPDGGCERMFYDAEGNRIKHILPESYNITTDDGEGWTYTYDAEHHLQTITGPDSICLASYRYDLAGNVIEETDAQGNTTYQKYTLHGKLAEVLKPVKKMTPLLAEAFRIENKHASNIIKHSPQVTKEKRDEVVYEKTTYTYDKNNNLMQEYHHSGYWNKHGILQEKDGIDLIITFTYDKRNRRIGVEDNTGAVTRFQYDVQGKLIYEEKAISKEIHQIIHYQYDKAGHLIEKKEQLASGLPTNNDEQQFAITRYRYDENGNRIELITPEGYHIHRTYDVCDRLASERVVDKQNGIDRTVYVSYDLAGNITKVTRQGKGCEVWELQYDYDFKDRITHIKDCLGPIFTYTYNKNDWLTTELLPQTTTNIAQEHIKNQNTYHYNCYGQVIQTVDGKGIVQEQNQYLPNGTLASTKNADGSITEYSYGIHGLQTKLHTARSKNATTPAQTLTYDSRGRITGIIDGNQNQTNYSIDSWGRIQTVHHPDGSQEKYTYNFAGHITTTTDANGGTITYRYNSQGNVCEIIDQEGNSETFHYDREGRLILHIDRNGNQVKTTYNVDGNPVLECACDNTGKQEVTRSWEYDSNGTVKKAIAGGFCYTYQHRPDGKLLQKQSSGKTVLACTYYNDGSLESLTDISGKTIYYHYDWQGKLSKIQDETGQALVQYAHTLGGKLKEIHHKNGMSILYDYDTEGNIVHLHLENKEGETISDFHYDYDGNENRILKTGTFTEKTGLKQSNISYYYDKKNQLIKESQDDETIHYHYDLCGNRLKKVDKNGTERYTYNRKNQLLHRDSNQEDTTYEYDLQGNILKATGINGITTYSYNALNQQTMVSMPNGNTLENYYDAEYLRAKTIENGTAKSFLYYNGELLTESKTDTEHTLINQYILGYGVAVGWNPEIKGYYSYHLDEQNSTAYITDEAGAIQNRYQYGAFGDIRQKQENIHNRILYTGQQYDQVSEQYYLRARFYNPIVGRFLQEDVYRGDGLNLYAYCANNPVMYYDPSGYSSIGPNCKSLNLSEKEDNSNTPQSTPCDLFAFGNSTSPRGARPKDFNIPEGQENTFIIQPRDNPPYLGASTTSNISKSKLSGYYYKLKARTQLPDGLSIINDNPRSGHHTIFPTQQMTLPVFNQLYLGLPWQYVDKK